MHKGLTFKLYWIENFSIPRLRLVTHTHEEIRRLRNAVRYRRSQKNETGSDCHLATLCQKAYGFSSPWTFPSYHDTLHARRVSQDNFVFRKSDISVNFSRLDFPSFSRGYCSNKLLKVARHAQIEYCTVRKARGWTIIGPHRPHQLNSIFPIHGPHARLSTTNVQHCTYSAFFCKNKSNIWHTVDSNMKHIRR